MSERERDSDVIDVDHDITAPGASKQTNRTVTDRLIKKPSHEDFVAAWSEAVLGKGLTFDFFSDPLVRKAILVTAQCADSIITSSSTNAKDTVLPRRTTWTAKILPATDDRLQQEAMRVLTPLYKEIGACFMGDGWQSTSNRPILNILAASDGFINVRRAFDASGQDKNMPFIANSMVAEMRTLGQENVFSCTMDDACKGAFPIIQAQLPWVQCFVCPSVVFGHDKCLCMRAHVEHRRVDTQQAQEQIDATKCRKGSACPWQPRPQEGYFAIQRAESRMGLVDTHQ